MTAIRHRQVSTPEAMARQQVVDAVQAYGAAVSEETSTLLMLGQVEAWEVAHERTVAKLLIVLCRLDRALSAPPQTPMPAAVTPPQ